MSSRGSKPTAGAIKPKQIDCCGTPCCTSPRQRAGTTAISHRNAANPSLKNGRLDYPPAFYELFFAVFPDATGPPILFNVSIARDL
jgi:hypothetical protein